MTKHNYPFQCGHVARASNEYVMGAYVKVGNGPAKVAHRLCPSCHRRVLAAIDRCYVSGRKSQERRQPQALPELEEV